MKKIMTIIVNNNLKATTMLLIFMLLATFSMITSAHTLKETTARISLRDGQVEVRLWLDMNRWQSHLQDSQAWLLGDNPQVMSLGLTPKETNLYLKNVLHKQILLMLNNQSVSLQLMTILSPKNSTEHHDYTEVVLTGKHKQSSVEQLNIVFPKSLGVIHASFVKPKYQLVAAGSNVQVSFSGLE